MIGHFLNLTLEAVLRVYLKLFGHRNFLTLIFKIKNGNIFHFKEYPKTFQKMHSFKI